MSYKLDHRDLAVEMELYFFDEQVGAGLPMWLPNGAIVREELEKFIKEKEFKYGYQRVSSPHLARKELYEQSGHLRWYKEDMYPEIKKEGDDSAFFLRPMNCPHHHKIFASKVRSYRELPLRLAEYGQVYRFEASGALRGLSRVRGLCQNDGHIYVDPDYAKFEILNVLKLHEECYQELNLKGYRYRLSKHDPEKLHELEGEQRLWIKAENILRECLEELGLEFFEEEGEAAFYGPKIDIQMKFLNGDHPKEESVSSVQLDFLSGPRFDLKFSNSKGEKICPWIIHRAPLGSHERFIAMLLEYFDGLLPLMLAPIQLLLFPISEKGKILSRDIQNELREKGVRVVIDEKDQSLGKRLMLARKFRSYASCVVGNKEVDCGMLSLVIQGEERIVSIERLRELLVKRGK